MIKLLFLQVGGTDMDNLFFLLSPMWIDVGTGNFRANLVKPTPQLEGSL